MRAICKSQTLAANGAPSLTSLAFSRRNNRISCNTWKWPAAARQADEALDQTDNLGAQHLPRGNGQLMRMGTNYVATVASYWLFCNHRYPGNPSLTPIIEACPHLRIKPRLALLSNVLFLDCKCRLDRFPW